MFTDDFKLYPKGLSNKMKNKTVKFNLKIYSLIISL